MRIELLTMKKIHSVQLEMMKELIVVMNKLDVKYYFVHGSLLGAVVIEDFIPEDDDIDIAIMREDYNRLLEQGNKYLPEHYFLQSSQNDDFPLSFAKMRDSRTSFIQPVLDNCKCNKGIYIDIFPIDYSAKNKAEKVIEKLMSIRINRRLVTFERLSYKGSLVRAFSLLFFPSYSKTICDREIMYSRREVSENVSLTNGKVSEQNIPLKWFDKGVKKKFCGIDVTCPSMYHDYLKKVYSENYISVNPAKERLTGSKLIEISAEVLDFEQSYKEYED